MKEYRLVRDRVVEDPDALVHIASDDEYHCRLKDKLFEEAREFVEAESIEELADILEVLEAFMDLYKIDRALLYHVKDQRARREGRFHKRLILCVDK